MQNYKNLQRNLIILFLTLSIIPLSAIGWLSFISFRESIYHVVTQNLFEIAKNKALAIDKWLFERSADAKFISESPVIVESITTLVNPDISKSMKIKSKKRVTNYLKSMKTYYGCYEEIFILDNEGNFVVSTGELQENKVGRDYFTEAKQGKTTVTDIRMSEHIGRPTMLVSCPIKDASLNIIGVLVSRIDLNTINTIMQDIEIGKTGESYLINKNGYFITESKFEPGHTLKEKIETYGASKCLKGKNGVGEYVDYRGKMVLGAYYWIPERKWCLIAEQDRSEAFREIHRLRNRTLAVGLTAIITIFIITLQISKKIVQRLQKADRELREKQEQLIHSGKLAAVGEMAAGLAHEVNNPLTTVKTLVHSIHTFPELKQGMKKDTSIIMEELDKINMLILRFLQFARPKEPELEPTNINEILKKIIHLLKPQINQQKITLSMHLEEGPVLYIDGSQIGQSFMNIIMNAIQATPDNGKLKISTKRVNINTKSYTQITIKDTGVGIPASLQKKIFDPFFTTKSSGTGLGLAITKVIIEKHNGMIEFHSKEGEGSIFLIYLPIEGEKH